jgi:predicted aminopeptidase
MVRTWSPWFRACFSRLAAVVALSFLLGACSSLRYYAQAAHGQAELIWHQRKVSAIVHDPSTAPALAARLQLALEARRFASEHLGLPDNRSYTGYVDLHRPYVVWNVFAAPRFSVAAIPQCFPIAGCVAYRGYFSEAAANADATRLAAGGDDVWVGGVPAYSTLGWFADPILSSMLRWDDDELDGTIFHELAHQLIYVKGDTAFNESFATFVQRQGLREWRKSRGLPPRNAQAEVMATGFTRLVLGLRDRLKALYASGEDSAVMAASKQREIEAFRQRYREWQQREWPGDHRYDAWVAKPVNNARLLPFGLYDEFTPAFAVLFERAEGHWSAFYAEVSQLAKLPGAARERQLRHLVLESGAEEDTAPRASLSPA